MDAIRSSRKRNHPSSSPPHPLSGAFTRSRSQLALHRNRSGQFRSDPGRINEPYVRSRRSQSPPMSRGIDTKQRSSENDVDFDDDDTVLIRDLRKKPKQNREASTGDGEDPSLLLIKDLRARRVYSPQSSAPACPDLIKDVSPQGNDLVDSGGRDQKIVDLGLESSFSVEKENSGSEMEGLKVEGESDRDSDVNVDVVIGTRIVASESPDFDQGSTGLSCESNELQDRKQCDGKYGGGCSEKIDDLNGEVVLMTPPDAGICDNSEVNGDEGKRVEKVDTPFTGNDEKNAGDGFCPKDDSHRNDSVLKSKSVLRPRSQEKLFKAPGSVSYRRLFPFLMEIMGNDFGTSKLGYYQKDEKGINTEQEFLLPLSSQSQEGSGCELKSDSYTIRDTSQFAASEGDTVIAHANELSYGNGSKLTSSHCLPELPMQLHTKEVTSEGSSVLSVNDTCMNESKTDPTADFHCVNDVGNALHNDDFKQDSDHNNNLDYANATNHGGCSSEQFCVSNEECVLTTPPDVVIYDNPEVNVSQLESMSQDVYHVKHVGLTRSPQENAGEGFCLKTDKIKDSVLKGKSVPRSNLHSTRKLFKTPGSVSYRRLLPFLRDLTKDDPVTSKFGHQTLHQKDKANVHAKSFELRLWSQSQEASIDEHKTDSGPMHGTVKFNALGNNTLVDPANELSHGNQPQLTSSQGLPESPMQLDAEVVHKRSITLSVDEHIEKVEIGSKDKCFTDSKFDLCSVMADSHSGKNVTNAVHNDGFKQVHDKISIEHNNESPHKAQNWLYVNGDVPSLVFEHHSSKENGSAIDYDERKQFVSVEQSESVSRYAPEVQNPNHLDPNMLDAEENEASSHAISRSEDAVVLNHVSVVSNEEPRPPSEKIMLEKSDVPRHNGDKAESILNGIVLSPSMPSGGSNKSATCVGKIGNGYESKTPLVLNRCSQIKLLRHAGSFSFRRLLPFLMNTMENNSRASLIGHYPKLQKCLDQTLLPVSASNLRVIPISESNGCVPVEHCRGSSGTEQQTGLHAYDLNDDGSSPRFHIPKSQSPLDSCKVVKLQDEQVVLNGGCNLEGSPNTPISVHSIDLPVTHLGPKLNGVITRDEEAASALPESSIYSEVKQNSSFLMSSNGEKPPETHGCCQSLSHQKVLEQVRVPAVGFKKGILKRNPRGCKGLCTCLNCASFRLHAERAFEFSRNQLLYAEEVALDLIKELSHLRNMLERSADRVNDNPVFDGSQVEEACSKAFATEQLAKDRLSQMNDELNIHCSITSLQRPRVKFADNVEEKVIQPGR